MALFAANHIPPGPIGGPSTMPEEHREETYNEAFPSLGGSSNGGLKLTATRPAVRKAATNNQTEIMKISVEERKFDDHQNERLFAAVRDIQERSGNCSPISFTVFSYKFSQELRLTSVSQKIKA